MGDNSSPSLKHRSSIKKKKKNKTPAAVILPNGNNLLHNYKLVSLDFPTHSPSYTSLKDIITCSSPSSILSPTPGPPAYSPGPGAGSGYEISIRNRLVKQAAWAYLQPTVPSSPSSSSSAFSLRCNCLSGEVLRPIIGRVKELLCGTVTRVYDWLGDVFWLMLCR